MSSSRPLNLPTASVVAVADGPIGAGPGRTISNPGSYKLDYLRHVLSQANKPDNSGVHILDPVLERNAQGAGSCRYLLKGKRYTHVLISLSTRTIETTCLALWAWPHLTNVRIMVLPDLNEQTDWASDRPRFVRQIMEHVLRLRSLMVNEKPDEAPSIFIDFSLVLKRDEDVRKVFDRFVRAGADELPRIWEENVKLAANEELNRPWHTKTELYSPKRLQERGQVCLEKIITFMESVHRCVADPEVLVVGHGGFVNYLVEEVGDVHPDSAPPKLSDWKPGEIREYYLLWEEGLDGKSKPDGLLTETAKSRSRRVESGEWYDEDDERRKASRLQDAVMRISEENMNSPEHGSKYMEARTRIPDSFEGMEGTYLEEMMGKLHSTFVGMVA